MGDQEKTPGQISYPGRTAFPLGEQTFVSDGNKKKINVVCHLLHDRPGFREELAELRKLILDKENCGDP